MLLAAVAFGALLGAAIVGVRALNGDTQPAASPTESAPEPTPTPDPRSPRGAALLLAEAFENEDIQAIYDLLDEDSQFDRTLVDLEAVYNNFFTETTAYDIAVDVAEASDLGATLDVTLSTAYFGDLEYAIPLSFTPNDNGDYRLRWSPASVHPELADGRRVVSEINRPTRGAIYARDGSPLAHTVERRYIGLNRAVIDDRAAVTASLVAFGFSRAQVDDAFKSSIPANHRVGVGVIPEGREDDANQLVLGHAGILLYARSERVHPLGAATAHVVGYTRQLTAEELEARQGSGSRIGDRVGATGLERSMHSRLAGQPGGAVTIVDRSGELVTTLAEQEFIEGEDIQTTLDPTVLTAAHERFGGQLGAAVVIDPRTNELLAVTSSPSFDPNVFEQDDWEAISEMLEVSGNPLSNRAASGLYSAGSVFKLVTGAAGLMSGVYSTADTLECGATWDRFDPPRRNWEGAQGMLTIAGGLRRSCNPVFYEIAYQLYSQADDGYLSDVARLFGFGSDTGTIGIDDEAGLVPGPEWKLEARGEPWYAGDEVNLGIGQGDLLITPLQLANAYSAFVNNQLRAPVLIEGEVAEDRGEIGLTPGQHAHLLEGLKQVTGPGGTAAGAFANAGYHNFAGKSGTAEDANEQQHALFSALYPADNASAIAIVVLDEGDSGSLEAAPIARDILLSVTP